MARGANDLRARLRERHARAADAVQLGDRQAQEYFASRQFKQRRRAKPASTAAKRVTRKATKPSAAKDEGDAQAVSNEPERDDGEDNEEDNEEDDKLVLPPHGEVIAALQRVDGREAAYREAAKEFPRFEHLFESWKSQLRVGNNLLISGVGSKLAVLQEFASTTLTDGFAVQLHGYLPTVSIRYLCSFINEEVLRVNDKSSRTLPHQCQEIARAMATRAAAKMPTRAVYLVVHSIDGATLRTPEIQSCLSWLASAPTIHVVASIDHINGSSMWQEADMRRFQWISLSVDTLRPYTTEIELHLVKQTKVMDASGTGVRFILQSLTPTDVGTLQEIGRQQLAATAARSKTSRSRRQAAKSVLYQTVYDACRKRLLHTSVVSMKNSIKCLEDHGLVKLLRVQSHEELEIPLPDAIITADILQLAPEKQ